MISSAFAMKGVHKSYKHFQLRGINLELPSGCIMGFIGPNGAGKSTTIRILMGLVHHDSGTVEVLGKPMPISQHEVKLDIGFVSEDMRLYDGATVAWHMSFIASIYSSWDKPYAEKLLRRFNLNPDHKVKGLSRGQAVKTSLLLALAHHPRLLILDEPTTGLDPIVRQEVLAELMDVLLDEERSILMSSQNTQDVQQISDVIALIDGGAILEIDEKEAFLDRWRRLILEIDPKMSLPGQGGFHTLSRNGRTCVLTTGRYSDQMRTDLEAASANLIEVQPMTLEEIFLARIQIARKGAAL